MNLVLANSCRQLLKDCWPGVRWFMHNDSFGQSLKDIATRFVVKPTIHHSPEALARRFRRKVHVCKYRPGPGWAVLGPFYHEDAGKHFWWMEIGRLG